MGSSRHQKETSRYLSVDFKQRGPQAQAPKHKSGHKEQAEPKPQGRGGGEEGGKENKKETGRFVNP